MFVWQVDFSPLLPKLAQTVDILPQLIESISGFKHLPEIQMGRAPEGNPIHVNIGEEPFSIVLLLHLHPQEQAPLLCSCHIQHKTRS